MCVCVCVQLLVDKELSVLIRQLYFIVLEKLCTEHFLTALDIAQACQWITHSLTHLLTHSLTHSPTHTLTHSADPKSSPTGLFCLVVGDVNRCMHLIEKLYRDTVAPCIR